MQQQLLKPDSKEHALQIIQQGYQLYQQQGHMSFSENIIPQQQSERMSFNDNDKRAKNHPKVHNIFEMKKNIKNSVPQSLINNHQRIIPQLPSGRYLKFQIISNWGDKQQVGLNGIEIFDSQGGNITRYIKMCMQDDYLEKVKLIDGYQAVQDDLHIWRTKKQKPEITLDLTANIKLSLIRIWNYNKSRIRSYKGVRQMKILFDDRLIFQGEIQKASGDLKRFQENCEYILFTDDIKIMKRIDELDWLNKRAIDYSTQWLQQTISLQQQERPNTGSKLQSNQKQDRMSLSRLQQQQQFEQQQSKIVQVNYYPQKIQNKLEKPQQQSMIPEFIQTIDILLEFNNSSKRFLGLNGMILLDETNKQIHQQEISTSNLDSYDLQKLFYSNNPTTNDVNFMIWLKQKKIYFKFKQQIKLSMIKFFNFNQSISQSTITGPELVKITYNGKIKYFNLRPAPCDQINFCQIIQLTQQNNTNFFGNLSLNQNLWSQNYFIAYPPCGMLVTLHLISTWGDNNYIGLNGLELYDDQGNTLLCNKLIPYTIHSVPELENDPRIVQNLTKSPQDINCKPQDSYLAPFINTPMEKIKNKSTISIQNLNEVDTQDINKIYILFDKMTQFSVLDFFNYTKDWQRGVKEIHIFINNRLIFQGNLNQTQQDLKGNIFNKTTILLSDQNLIKSKINPYFFSLPDEQVTLINESKLLNTRDYQQHFQHIMSRPSTSVK